MTRVPILRPGERSLRLLIAPITALLADTNVTELCVNRPGEVFVERRGENGSAWCRHIIPELDIERLTGIATLAASLTAQDVSAANPLCSTIFPDGERVQIVQSPAVAPGLLSLTIRKPSAWTPTLDALAGIGLFGQTRLAGARAGLGDDELSELRNREDWRNFFAAAVRFRKNIILCGATGSGKTTLAKALITAIGREERVLTIEDTPELTVNQPNRVHLFYAKGGQGLAQVSAQDLLEATLRMRPDRVLLQELRDGSAFTYLRGVASGHPGSITTIHADSAQGAFVQLALLIKQSEAGRHLADADIRALLHQLIDVVAHCAFTQAHGFHITEVYFDPSQKGAGAECLSLSAAQLTTA